MVEFNNTAGVVKFVAYDNALTSPINGTADLFAMTFKVSNVAVGTAVSLASSGVIASDGAADVNVGNAGYSVTIAEPLSGNTFLSGLTIDNAALSPAFNKNTSSYQVQVPYSVSRLSIKATAEDAKSKVTINQPNLTPGGTTKVTITVQAQTAQRKPTPSPSPGRRTPTTSRAETTIFPPLQWTASFFPRPSARI